MKQLIRLLEERDLPQVREWRNHPNINHFMFSQGFISEKEHLTWFHQNSENTLKNLFIYEENESRMGFMQLQQTVGESGVFEWGFYINPDAEKGTGTRMTTLMLDKIFREFQAKRIFAKVLAYNLPSIKLHLKLEFKCEGVLRKHHFMSDEYYDVHCFGLLKEEWLQSKQY
jgi:UDP-4-amino-4,6-dideoxy-N-acetyl-beta-L-altrosamine N-acetyltransferase